MAPYYALLLAVKVLHGRGYEALKAVPYIYHSLRTWRLALGVVGRPVNSWGLEHTYSHAAGWQIFSAENKPASPRRIAGRIEKQFPELMKAAHKKSPYAQWFADILNQAGYNGYFILRVDDYNAAKEGYVKVCDDMGHETKAPLAPVH